MSEVTSGLHPYPPGTILYVKTTDEPVTFIALSTHQTAQGTSYFVRRPISTRDGLVYDFFDFYSFELETAIERDNRLLSEHQRRKEALEALDTPSEPRPTNFLKN